VYVISLDRCQWTELSQSQLLDEWGDIKKPVDGESGCLAALSKLKRQNPQINTFVSIGGGTGSAEFPELAANPAARATFAQELREFCDKYQFDGVDSQSCLL
jgi:chitinase